MKISTRKIIDFLKPNPLKLAVFTLLIVLSIIFLAIFFYEVFGFVYPANFIDYANKSDELGFFLSFLVSTSIFLNLPVLYFLQWTYSGVFEDTQYILLAIYLAYTYLLSILVSHLWVRNKKIIYLIALMFLIIDIAYFSDQIYKLELFMDSKAVSLTCKVESSCPDGKRVKGQLPFCSLPPCDQISSFEECQKAGYPIAESYPRKCVIQGRDGAKTFTEEIKSSIFPSPKYEVCTSQCGDKVCQQIVCLGTGCPCSETKFSCPQDCK